MTNDKLLILAVVGLGAYLFISKNASAQTQRPTPAAAARPTVTGRPVPQVNPLVAGLGALGAVVNGVRGLFGGASSSPNEVYDNSSTVGEAAARSYYLNNQDLFAVNPPNQYASYDNDYGGIDAR